jgi:hypothetical protein
MPARKTRQVETRMMSEYLLKNFNKFPCIMAQPLGVVDEKLMAAQGYERAIKMSRPYRPECDAIVILPNHLLLIEAKVWNIVNGLAKLPLYKSLVPATPELREYLPRNVIMRLVVGWTNTNLQIMARDQGIEIDTYAPPWLTEIVNSMQKYWTPEYQQARQKKIEMREYFGVE